jgi:uncharacterized RmlC-like cupin family protein
VQKYKKFIKKGVIEQLENIPFHGKAPLKRLSMLSKKLIPESNTHIAVHFVDSAKNLTKYSQLHEHDRDEINLILSQDSKITYEIQLNDEVYKVTSPSTIFIPKGIKHRAQVLSGRGIFVCIILSDRYVSK